MIHVDVRYDREASAYRVEKSIDGAAWSLEYVVEDGPQAEFVARVLVRGARLAGGMARATSAGHELVASQ